MPGHRAPPLQNPAIAVAGCNCCNDLLQLRVLSVIICIDGILLLNVQGSHVLQLGAGRYASEGGGPDVCLL